MLETIQEYAHERLEASGEADAWRQHHAAYFLIMAEAAEWELRGPQQRAWLERLDEAHDNLRAALQWALDHGEVETALRFGVALWSFWETRGYFSEAGRWFEAALAASGAHATAARAAVLSKASHLAWLQGDDEQATRLAEDCLVLARALDDTLTLSRALSAMAIVVSEQGEHMRAEALLEEALALARDVGNNVRVAVVLGQLGFIVMNQGEYARATQLLEEALMLSRDVGDTHTTSMHLMNLGGMAVEQGHYAQALVHYTEALRLSQEIGNMVVPRFDGHRVYAALASIARRRS